MSDDFELLKRQIEVQLIEYQQEIESYAAFWKSWQERNSGRERDEAQAQFSS
jgi:hypothetical protein